MNNCTSDILMVYGVSVKHGGLEKAKAQIRDNLLEEPTVDSVHAYLRGRFVLRHKGKNLRRHAMKKDYIEGKKLLKNCRVDFNGDDSPLDFPIECL